MCGTCYNDFCGGCDPAACGAGPGNTPITDCEYQGSVLRQLQGTIDQARRLSHVLGTRPYRVSMVWEQRDRHQVFQRVKVIELTPVEIADTAPISGIGWDSTEWARRRSGDLLLTQISPQQVTENDLYGRLDGLECGPDVQFYYEVTRLPLCATDTLVRPQRYTTAGMPEFTGTEWVVRVSPQDNSRTPDGQDATHTRTRPPLGLDKLRR